MSEIRSRIENILITSGMEWHENGARELTGDVDAILATIRDALLRDEAVATLEAGIVAYVLAPENADVLGRRMRPSATRAEMIAALDAAGIREADDDA